MSESINTEGGNYYEGDITAGTFIGGNLIVVLSGYTGNDLEKVRAAVRAAFATGKAERRADLARKRLTVTAPGVPSITLSEEAAAALFEAARHRANEPDYLADLVVNPRFGRWASQFVPLAGWLTPIQHPPGWNDVEPEYSLIQIHGDGPQRQYERTRLEDIPQAFDRHPAVALLGEPGAGKTTSLLKLALDAASRRLANAESRLPLFLSLANYRNDASPYAFVEATCQRLYGETDLTARLRSGGFLLLFDALNEMPFEDDRDYRQKVADWRDFQKEWPGNRMVFSCRSRDYLEPLGLPQVEIERLDDGRVRDFLGKYLSTDLAGTAWARLEDSPLLELVRNPYYLNMLAYTVAKGGAWPRNRAALFDGFAKLLLLREQERHHPDWLGFEPLRRALSALAESLQPLGEGTRLPRRQMLERIPSHVPGPDGDAPTPPPTVLRLGLAATLLDMEKVGDEEQARFYHHQLQEYFAACALRDRFRAGEDPSTRFASGQVLSDRWKAPRAKSEMPDPGKLGDFEPMPPPPTTGWEEPTIIAAGLLADPAPFIQAVCRHNPALAARCLSELGTEPEADTLKFACEALLKDMGDSSVHARARLLAGDALGRLGEALKRNVDPRFKEITVNGWRVILPPLVRIPAGPAKIGSSLWQVLRLMLNGFLFAQDERPRHQVNPPEFHIGQFPVTNAEYNCFIQAGGYQNESYWRTPAALAWLRGETTGESPRLKEILSAWRRVKANPALLRMAGIAPQQRKGFEELIKLDEEQVREMFNKQETERSRDCPAFWTDDRFNNPSHPVVGVTWFEANAYCAWLDEQWRGLTGADGNPALQNNTVVRLPTEAEWEKAARLKRGWVYPWGNRWEADRANTVESRLLKTTPVGMYPNGATPEGLHDLSGNVWEWTSSLYKPYPYQDDERNDPNATDARVVRGGSWGDNGRNARCAYRFMYVPDYFGNNLGLRVVVSLAFSGF